MCTYSSTNTTLYMFSLLYIGLRKPWVWQQYWGTPAISSERKLHHSQFKHKSGFRPQNQTVCQEEFRHRSGRGKDRGYRLHYKGHAHDISARWVALRKGGWCFFPIYFRDKKIIFSFAAQGFTGPVGFYQAAGVYHTCMDSTPVREKVGEILRSIELAIKKYYQQFNIN